MPTTKFTAVPKTVGELITLLKKFPADANLSAVKQERVLGTTEKLNHIAVEHFEDMNHVVMLFK